MKLVHTRRYSPFSTINRVGPSLGTHTRPTHLLLQASQHCLTPTCETLQSALLWACSSIFLTGIILCWELNCSEKTEFDTMLHLGNLPSSTTEAPDHSKSSSWSIFHSGQWCSWLDVLHLYCQMFLSYHISHRMHTLSLFATKTSDVSGCICSRRWATRDLFLTFIQFQIDLLDIFELSHRNLVLDGTSTRHHRKKYGT